MCTFEERVSAAEVRVIVGRLVLFPNGQQSEQASLAGTRLSASATRFCGQAMDMVLHIPKSFDLAGTLTSMFVHLRLALLGEVFKT